MALAMFCRIMVLPVRGGATINPRCPFPIGAAKSKNACGQFVFCGFHDDTLYLDKEVSSFQKECFLLLFQEVFH